MGGGVDIDPGAAGVEHAADPADHKGPIHPMKRLGERDHPEGAEAGGQVLGPHMPPLHAGDIGFGGTARSVCDHVAVGVHTDRLLEQGREQKRQ